MHLNSFLESDSMRSLNSKLINLKASRDKGRLRELMRELHNKENAYLYRDFMKENGFRQYHSGGCVDTIYSLTDFSERPTHAIVFSAFDNTIAYVKYFGTGGMQYTVVREIETVADLEDILDMLGIDKELKFC